MIISLFKIHLRFTLYQTELYILIIIINTKILPESIKRKHFLYLHLYMSSEHTLVISTAQTDLSLKYRILISENL